VVRVCGSQRKSGAVGGFVGLALRKARVKAHEQHHGRSVSVRCVTPKQWAKEHSCQTYSITVDSIQDQQAIRSDSGWAWRLKSRGTSDDAQCSKHTARASPRQITRCAQGGCSQSPARQHERSQLALSPRVSLVQKERRVFSLLQAAAVEWSWWWSQRRTGQADSPSFRGDKFVRERALSLADPTIKTVR
jgi:hypothetical protein